MALPRSNTVQVYSLRSSDQPADEGVLPGEAEIKHFGIKLICLAHTTHNAMYDSANDKQRKEIQALILRFLKD